MKITVLSIIIAVVALIELIRTVRRIRRDELGLRSAAIWTLLWTGLLYFAVFPAHLEALAEIAQMRRTLLFASAVGIVVLFTLVFNLSSRLEKAQRQIARLTQELAIQSYDAERRIDGLQRKLEEHTPDKQSSGEQSSTGPASGKKNNDRG